MFDFLPIELEQLIYKFIYDGVIDEYVNIHYFMNKRYLFKLTGCAPLPR